MRTKEQYMKALSKMKKNIYYNGEKIDRLVNDRWPVSILLGQHMM